MKIRRINESAEFNFNSAASSGNWPYKMSIETYVDICDEISQIIDNLDQSCVFAIARDATNLGLNIDKERLYYSPIVTIENNISPEKINQFRSIVMKYSDKQLNEDYLDSAEYRIQRYEDDIPELMAGMHNDYMEGKLDAARYAEVLKKVYDALSEFDYKNTMISPKTAAGKRVLDALNKLDEEVDAYNPLDKDDKDYKDFEYDDDFDDLSSFNECSDVKRADVLYGVERNESLTEARYTDTNGIMGRSGAAYSDADLRKAWEDGKDSDPSMQAYNGDFDAWKKDTIGNMNKNEAFDMSHGPDLGKLSWQVASYLDVDALGEDKWIEFICDDPRDTIGGKKSMGFEAIGEDAHMYGFIRTNGDAVDVKFRNGSEAVCHSAEEVARFIAGEFGISI